MLPVAGTIIHSMALSNPAGLGPARPSSATCVHLSALRCNIPDSEAARGFAVVA